MSDDTSSEGAVTFLRGDNEGAEKVTYVELFFDLVFAFAITQISGVLGDELSLLSLLEGAVVTFAVWWVWVYTAWATNWLNPDRRLVLWFLLVLTAIGLIISEAIPSAFTDRGATFAIAYLIYGFTRTIGVIIATRHAAPAIAGGQARILLWSCVSGAFWVTGILLEDPWLRLSAWAVAIGIEYAGPSVLFWIPGAGRSNWTAWKIRGGHFSERAALFIIIVLGESILVIGRGLTIHEPNVPEIIAASSAFISAVAMWFLYFAHGQDRGREYIAERDTSGPTARISYTYLHVVIVLGLVLSTHGAELALDNPDERSDIFLQGLIFAGTAIYLIGLLSFKVSIGVRAGWIPSHLVGTAVLLIMFVLAATRVIEPSRLEAAVLASAILSLVVLGDEILWNLREGKSRTRSAPSPHRLLR